MFSTRVRILSYVSIKIPIIIIKKTVLWVCIFILEATHQVAPSPQRVSRTMTFTVVMLLKEQGPDSQDFSATWEITSYIREKFSSMSVNPAWLQTSQIYYQHFD